MDTARKQVSKGEIDKAGIILKSPAKALSDTAFAFRTVEEWRATYSDPLRIVTALLRRASLSINRHAIVSSRLKRMESIIHKLQRPQTSTMALTAMQDLGGCRVVFWPISEVRTLIEGHSSWLGKKSIGVRDYIKSPKSDGYRGIHVVVKYQSKNPKYAHWNGKKIEIQVRSTLQHAWATAVETVDLFAGQTLKLGSGDAKWRRFFALASSVFARLEDCPIVPDTPDQERELKRELGSLWHELNVLNLMQGWATAAGHLPQSDGITYAMDGESPTHFLVWVRFDEGTVHLIPYTPDGMDKANHDYSQLERDIRAGMTAQAVLVSVDAVEQIRRAFPNFYADTRDFLKEIAIFLNEPINPKRRKDRRSAVL